MGKSIFQILYYSRAKAIKIVWYWRGNTDRPVQQNIEPRNKSTCI